MSKVDIYDTTLRDGMQGIEVSYTLQDKLQIAYKLDEMKIDYIEGGFPLANEKEAAFFSQIRKKPLSHAKLVAFGSTRKPGKKVGNDNHITALLSADTPAVAIVGKAWDAHVTKVIGTNLEENLSMIYDSISFCKAQGREVVFDLEHFFDGYAHNPEYAMQVLKTGTEAGADVLVLCDTNGGTLPNDVQTVLGNLPQGELAPLGAHFHNDCGTAIANSVVAVASGATHVQGTVNGWGERCGNADLCGIIPNLALKMNKKVAIAENLSELTPLSRYIAEKANIIPDKRQPYVGTAAFSHKAGQHADVILKEAQLMEHIDSSKVGNSRQILLSELAGKSTIVRKLKPYGQYDKKSPEVAEITEKLKEKESSGYEYEAAEASFDLLIRKNLGRYKSILSLNNYHLESFKTGDSLAKTVGRIFVENDGKRLMGAGIGLGPVDALDKSLRDALRPFFPFIDKISLIDYRVRVLNPEHATAAKVRVFITSSDSKRTWDTVGVSENIVEASWEAIVESIEYYYNNYVLEA